ncbi:MAG: Uncharacterized protein Athens071426_70 [Parcubacteria group bacterium Athens0714_26]|nr:MAG: peptidase M16 domain-containing protein [Parcubacteria group bacterium Athens1014_26]TSD03737.1 MAG: Uncharacterized protein Athens071426_70 [Parcubacteria group bacterium Athens0714_26]
MKPFKKYVLKNGLRIILVPEPRSLAVTALVLVEAGSKYENKKINGISHFLEHLCFKGTSKRPTPLMIASELESIGAVFSAFTSLELTGYFAKVSSDKINQALDVISDIYIDSIFDEKELEREKGVIMEEINMDEDNPMKKVQEIFEELLYGDQPAGWSIAGTKEIIRSLDRRVVIDYRRAHYVPQATAVVVAGAFNEAKMLKEIKKCFGGISEGGKTNKIKVKEAQISPNAAIHFKESDQTHLVLGFRAFDMFDKRRHALAVLSKIIGGGMGSRLFQKIRGELGAAYYIYSEEFLLTDHGFLAVSAGVDNTKVKKVIGAILDEFRKIKSAPVSPEELRRAKSHITGKLMIELETSDAVAGFYGQQEIFKEKIITPKEAIKKIEAVTAGDILNVAKDIINDKGLNLALIGPFKESKEFESVLKL